MAEPRLPKGTSKNHCENIDIFYLGQEKNFASGQLIFDNWSVGLNFANLMNVNM